MYLNGSVLSLRHGAPPEAHVQVPAGSTQYAEMQSKNCAYVLNLARTVFEKFSKDPSYHGLSFLQLQKVAEGFKAAHINSFDELPASPATPRPVIKFHQQPLLTSYQQPRQVPQKCVPELQTGPTKKPLVDDSVPENDEFHMSDAEDYFDEITLAHQDDEFELEDAESYFPLTTDPENLVNVKTENSTEEEAEFDLPDAEAYFES